MHIDTSYRMVAVIDDFFTPDLVIGQYQPE